MFLLAGTTSKLYKLSISLPLVQIRNKTMLFQLLSTRMRELSDIQVRFRTLKIRVLEFTFHSPFIGAFKGMLRTKQSVYRVLITMQNNFTLVNATYF